MLKTTICNIKNNNIKPVDYVEDCLWGEVKLNNGDIILYTGQMSELVSSQIYFICKSKKIDFHNPGGDELGDDGLPLENDFEPIDPDLRIAIAYMLTKWSNGRIYFYDHPDKAYQLMIAADSDLWRNGIESTAFKKYEQTYMPSIVEKADLGSMTASASDDASVEAQSIETQTDLDSMRSTGVQTGQ